MTEAARIRSVANQFAFAGEFARAERWGSGHIQESYCVECNADGAPRRYLLQRINQAVFHDVPALMENIRRVTEHVAEHVKGQPDAERRVLRLVATHDRRLWHEEPGGACWRAYQMIQGTWSFEAVESPEQAFEAARAFGEFQAMLADLPPPRLAETIPDFHNTPKRLAALEQTVAQDAVGRVASAQVEIEFALARRELAAVLVQGGLPERIVHNDTKLSNVLFDEASGRALCVIDLDTVMPGMAPCDFGDMARTATCSAAEDERDLTKVAMQLPLFEALLRGYVSAASGFLTHGETAVLGAAGKVITYEQGIRFLTDYLAGDRYYRVHREGQNLDRCRTQFALLASMEHQEAAMERLVRAICV
ncbi:MAG: aminoglycoside phosphotransferase family protein [Acidobacteriota bacterium]|nr:aminoglycoside phosphotransferase family protein [Acidobacteriota bacterium]